ncbi:glycosyltransferase family A protein [Acinetobacter shaoyimingii]|uniref:Glycosyltransferase family 2 protein n=1 Tax=Acinetobacter shaoyimingii TaxID=2715164 RepID=A0A6G8RYH0_9GAMM|nr:glycosyltransferase family 2 protein [Acinetobacter shaoyimingii]QIO06848.1 glycosyltransferase family 2 protein [Acinetobacter shaoyimingii]
MFVSIIVPSYNHAPYLEKRIQSILNQTYQNFEVILLDDVSPDHSAEILLSYKNHPKVSHCIINEQNSGSTFSQWNKGLSLAKGELIWIAESDDVSDLSFLENLVTQFEINPNLTIAYCQSHRMNAEGIVTGDWKDYTDDLDSEIFESDFTMLGSEYIERFMMTKNTIPNASGVVFKKQTYFHVGGANQKLRWIGDWAIWSKIVAEGEIFFTAQKLNFFRYHATSVIARAVKNIDHIAIRNEVIGFRTDVCHYWEMKAKQNPKFYSILKKNNKYLFKEISRNASFAIRKRQYKHIIPTTKLTLKSCPIYLLPLYTVKLSLKLIYSFLIDAPIRKIFK